MNKAVDNNVPLFPANSLRIFFATDIHGSTKCFRQFLGAIAPPLHANVLILGGDIAAKELLLLVPQSNGKTLVANHSPTITLDNESEVAEFCMRAEDIGKHVYRCSEDEYKHIQFSEELKADILKNERISRLKSWLALAEEHLSNSDVKLIINCGNDDHYYLDPVLDESPIVERPEGRVISLPGGIELVSCGYSIETPWKCPRDKDIGEPELQKMLELMLLKLKNPRKAVFNFHCPPFDTTLDKTARLDLNHKPVMGSLGVEEIHVGSTSIRHAIEVYQPVLSLHGHIHGQHCREKIGETFCYNPGSFFEEGRLSGVYAVLENGSLKSHHLLGKIPEPLSTTSKSLLYSLLKTLPVFKQIAEVFEKHESGAKFDDINIRLQHIEDSVKKTTKP